MDEVLELLIWAFIVALGWLWGGGRDRSRSRRGTGPRPARAPGGASPSARTRPAPEVSRNRRSIALSTRQQQVPADTAALPVSQEDGTEELSLEGPPSPALAGEGAPALAAAARAPFGALGAPGRPPHGPAVRGPAVLPIPPVAGELVKAVVAAEILGPPRALRPYRTPGSARRSSR